MKTLFSTVALAGALFVTAMAPLPASAQSAPAVLAAPESAASIAYSWGVLYAPNEGHQVAYTWSELNQPAEMAQIPAQSKGVEAGSMGHAAPFGDDITAPAFVTYSWGVLYAPNEGQQVAYTWDELNRRNGVR